MREGAIYTTSAEGSRQTGPLSDEHYCYNPTWAPTGDRVAFSARNEADARKNYVYVLDLAGSECVPLHAGREPAWSPDGSRVAFTCLQDGTYDILTASPDGSDIQNLTRNEDRGIDLREPAWLPDGNGVLFRRGWHQIQLVQLPELEESTVLASYEQIRQPACSPDGDRVAFVGLHAGREEIYVADLSASTVACLTDATSSFEVNTSQGVIQISRSHEPVVSAAARNSGVELIYGDGGEGLVFLERGYAEDIAMFREALFRASTWGELRERVPQQRYEETVEQWMESKREDEEMQIPPPSAEDPFVSSEIWGYEDGDWPEFAPRMMDVWLAEEIIQQYGGYVYPTLNAEYPLIDSENEQKIVSLLETEGYTCTRDDELAWNATWGG